MSRSELYSKAVLEYLANHKFKDATKALNIIYAHEDSSIDKLADATTLAAMHAQQMAKEETEELKTKLTKAIGDGLLDVDVFNDRVLIRIREKGSFGSGKSNLKSEFSPILEQIAELLKQRDRQFIISGYTDDIQIETKQFRSNWDVSTKRAASVVHFFILLGIDPKRMEILTHSDNQPLVPNDSWENRAQNRQVKIGVLHGNKDSLEMDSPSSNVDFVKGN